MIIKIEPDYTVIDIGAGPGTVAIPLAKTVKFYKNRKSYKEILSLQIK